MSQVFKEGLYFVLTFSKLNRQCRNKTQLSNIKWFISVFSAKILLRLELKNASRHQMWLLLQT